MRALWLLALLTVATGCSSHDGRETYYLYRNAIAGNERVHVATFDAKQGGDYNEENCMIVRGLMERQLGVQVGYWCSPAKP